MPTLLESNLPHDLPPYYQMIHEVVRREFPGFEINHGNASGENIVEILTRQREVYIRTRNNNAHTIFEFNPDLVERNAVRMAANQASQKHLPAANTVDGLLNLYQRLFYHPLLEELGVKASDNKNVRRWIDNPFDRRDGTKLISYKMQVDFLKPDPKILGNRTFQNLWSAVRGSNENTRLLNLYMLSIRTLTSTPGVDKEEKNEVVFMLIEKQDGETSGKATTKVIVRQITKGTKVDTTNQDLSSLIAYMRDANNMINPLRG